MDTSETATLSGRTIASITDAAPTMCPPKALPGDVYARYGDKLAEVAREDPVAARTIGEGASAPSDGRSSVLSPDEERQATDPGAEPTVFLGLTEETVMLASSMIGCC